MVVFDKIDKQLKVRLKEICMYPLRESEIKDRKLWIYLGYLRKLKTVLMTFKMFNSIYINEILS